MRQSCHSFRSTLEASKKAFVFRDTHTRPLQKTFDASRRIFLDSLETPLVETQAEASQLMFLVRDTAARGEIVFRELPEPLLSSMHDTQQKAVGTLRVPIVDLNYEYR